MKRIPLQCQCEHCKTMLDFYREEIGENRTCPSCGNELELLVSDKSNVGVAEVVILLVSVLLLFKGWIGMIVLWVFAVAAFYMFRRSRASKS